MMRGEDFLEKGLNKFMSLPSLGFIMFKFDKDGKLITTDNLSANLDRKRRQQERHEKTEKQLANKFFRAKIFEKWRHECFYCGTDQNLAIHHEVYGFYCPYLEKNMVDCENCSKTHSKDYNDCLRDCSVLCKEHHTVRHVHLLNETGDWVGHSKTKRINDGKVRCRSCDSIIENNFAFCPNCNRKLRWTDEELKKYDGKICEKQLQDLKKSYLEKGKCCNDREKLIIKFKKEYKEIINKHLGIDELFRIRPSQKASYSRNVHDKNSTQKTLS